MFTVNLVSIQSIAWEDWEAGEDCGEDWGEALGKRLDGG
jgi:hypothetical protein